jgi:SanA protein
MEWISSRISNVKAMQRLLQRMKVLGWKLVLCVLLLLSPIFIINFWILRAAASRVFTDVNTLPANDVGLILAAMSPKKGRINPFFQRRVEDAAQVYHSGKVKRLLLSGVSHPGRSNEPGDMKEALLKLGVPESAMVLDNSSFRTLDSVVRAKEVYGYTHLTIITSDYHTYRAIFLSRHYGIDAVAFSSEEVPLKVPKGEAAREWLARVKAVLDLYILRTQPKFLGPKNEKF